MPCHAFAKHQTALADFMASGQSLWEARRAALVAEAKPLALVEQLRAVSPNGGEHPTKFPQSRV